MRNDSDLFQVWREANRGANAFELQIVRAAMNALDGNGDPPSKTQIDEANKLRGNANELFVASMLAMRKKMNERRLGAR